jgi:glutamate formiminotransferase
VALVECVPNFSEGRRQEVIKLLRAAVANTPGVKFLDLHSDADHNRSVITFSGEPSAVLDAAFAAVACAAEQIDMNQHRGQHPRIGAADVVPFVPLEGISLEECADLARQLGERIGRELQLPVYLYEAAASRADRVNLADVRRGQYEGLKAAILQDPDRQPDYGPAFLGSAGAVAVGARQPLIAFNVYLTTDDVEIAKKIAQALRYSSGGLPHVKALGLLVKGRAQVSMNLTDYTQTSLPRVMEALRHEAAACGVAVHSSELVGLIPQAALLDSAVWYLQLDNYRPESILEERLRRL